jgi:nitrite reductase/ring-hydroxylating ferredoxin subunit
VTRDVGAVEEFPVGEFRVLELGRREIGVVRLGDGTFRAVRNKCPHAGAPLCRGVVGGTMLPSRPGELDFAPERLVVRCPWHAWEFDLATGEVVVDTRRERVKVYDVEAVDGRVLLDTRGVRRADL